MFPWIVFYLGATFGFFIGFLMAACLAMAAQGDRNQEAFESAHSSTNLQPVAEGFTWCPNCRAVFKGECCPGCAPNVEEGEERRTP